MVHGLGDAEAFNRPAYRDSRWSLDHLVVDQDAVPTFVEVKRASDTRARREVMAQMLDYAAKGQRSGLRTSVQARGPLSSNWTSAICRSRGTPRRRAARTPARLAHTAVASAQRLSATVQVGNAQRHGRLAYPAA